MHLIKSSQFVVPAPSTAARRDRELVPIQVIGPPARVRVVVPACVAGRFALARTCTDISLRAASRRVERLIDREGDGSRKFAEYSSTEATSLHFLGMVFWNVKSGKHVIGRCRVGRGGARLRALPGRFAARSIACLRVCPRILGPACSLHALHTTREPLQRRLRGVKLKGSARAAQMRRRRRRVATARSSSRRRAARALCAVSTLLLRQQPLDEFCARAMRPRPRAPCCST